MESKAKALNYLNFTRKLGCPLNWPEGAVALRVYGGDLPQGGVRVAREEAEKARGIAPGEYVLDSPMLVVED